MTTLKKIDKDSSEGVDNRLTFFSIVRHMSIEHLYMSHIIIHSLLPSISLFKCFIHSDVFVVTLITFPLNKAFILGGCLV